MENNLKSPAYPRVFEFGPRYKNDAIDEPGFTKLEKASLMIAQGICAEGLPADLGLINNEVIATASVSLAKAILEEANK